MNDDAIYDARIELIDFLVEVFWDVPTETFLETLLAGEIRTPEGSVNEGLDRGFEHLRTFVAANEGADLDAVRDRVRTEYTRVFVGPRPPVLPHESYYREDSDFLGTGLAAVESSYAAAEWSPPEDYPEENDFVAVELAFLRALVDRQRRGDGDAFGYERVFLEEHLDRWVEAFADDLREETECDLFLAAGEILEGLVEFEREIVSQQVR
ncbi:TorD/DmsD family molecular chaperone [Halomarina pelagica]|uniref:TorD/DmsD family molecular chaperone n=1 Tax=Halomarina pelagica TaxID=2961599 RepID=UPI0020C3F7F5|nr:molecular chaperone TorD family protein [Halomarina sp. BND7]